MIRKIFNTRWESINTGKNVDIATAEALAYATLLTEGFSIRLSG